MRCIRWPTGFALFRCNRTGPIVICPQLYSIFCCLFSFHFVLAFEIALLPSECVNEWPLVRTHTLIRNARFSYLLPNARCVLPCFDMFWGLFFVVVCVNWSAFDFSPVFTCWYSSTWPLQTKMLFFVALCDYSYSDTKIIHKFLEGCVFFLDLNDPCHSHQAFKSQCLLLLLLFFMAIFSFLFSAISRENRTIDPMCPLLVYSPSLPLQSPP